VTAPVCFIDTETTGLDPDRHAIWEVALITPNGDEHVWQFPVDEMAADPFALDIGRYWDRCWPAGIQEVSDLDAIYKAHNPKSRRRNFPDQGRAIKPGKDWCEHFRDLTAGLHLAGAVVSFDEERLRKLLHQHGILHRWHYHLVDVEALAAGKLGIEPPWKSDDLSAALGVTVSEEDRHMALGDARWAMRVYDAVMGRPS
jgi:DNA polymerase III epsilon subunit-like protein